MKEQHNRVTSKSAGMKVVFDLARYFDLPPLLLRKVDVPAEVLQGPAVLFPASEMELDAIKSEGGAWAHFNAFRYDGL